MVLVIWKAIETRRWKYSEIEVTRIVLKGRRLEDYSISGKKLDRLIPSGIEIKGVTKAGRSVSSLLNPAGLVIKGMEFDVKQVENLKKINHGDQLPVWQNPRDLNQTVLFRNIPLSFCLVVGLMITSSGVVVITTLSNAIDIVGWLVVFSCSLSMMGLIALIGWSFSRGAVESS